MAKVSIEVGGFRQNKLPRNMIDLLYNGIMLAKEKMEGFADRLEVITVAPSDQNVEGTPYLFGAKFKIVYQASDSDGRQEVSFTRLCKFGESTENISQAIVDAISLSISAHLCGIKQVEMDLAEYLAKLPSERRKIDAELRDDRNFTPIADVPTCPNCGHVATRNGACFKCLNCGESIGCS